MRLESKVVFITGAGAGIGRASARKCAREGARVVVAELDAASGEAIAGELRDDGFDALFVQTDVTDENSVRDSLAAAVNQFLRLDVLVNCAGGSIAADTAVTDVDLDVWEHTIALDLKGPFLCCRHGIPHLVDGGGGAIVNFTSVVALKGAFPGHVYTAAKGGIISLTQAVAGRYWRNGIRANAIAPGIILSERVASRMDVDLDASVDEQIGQAMATESRLVDHRHPFGYGPPEDIANIVAFLASDESRMVNGAVIPAEGGAAAY